jgi:uncharacterized protein (DUF2141 family)
MKKNLKHLASLVLVLLSSTLSAAELTLTVDGIKNNKGDLWITVFNTATTFSAHRNADATAMAKVPARTGAVSVTLGGLTKGNYAVAVIHDENRNAEFDQRGVMPLEGYGYSNNVGKTATPTFNQAKLTLKQDRLERQISLIYHR